MVVEDDPVEERDERRLGIARESSMLVFAKRTSVPENPNEASKDSPQSSA